MIIKDKKLFEKKLEELYPKKKIKIVWHDEMSGAIINTSMISGKVQFGFMGEYTAIMLPTIETSQAKRILKLKERDLNNFVKQYNQAVSKQPLTYYSQVIDQKIVFLTQIDGEFVGTVGQVSEDRRNRESLCAFCKQFRRGDKIVFATTSTPIKKSGEYSSVGQYCCSDYNRCNNSIEDSSALEDFVSFSMVKNKGKK